MWNSLNPYSDLGSYSPIEDITRISYSHDQIWLGAVIALNRNTHSQIQTPFNRFNITITIDCSRHPCWHFRQAKTFARKSSTMTWTIHQSSAKTSQAHSVTVR